MRDKYLQVVPGTLGMVPTDFGDDRVPASADVYWKWSVRGVLPAPVGLPLKVVEAVVVEVEPRCRMHPPPDALWLLLSFQDCGGRY